MNRAVSTWKKMFFKNNIGKIRKTVMDYLKEEGVKVEMENGLVIVGGMSATTPLTLTWKVNIRYVALCIGLKARITSLWKYPRRLLLQTKSIQKKSGIR